MNDDDSQSPKWVIFAAVAFLVIGDIIYACTHNGSHLANGPVISLVGVLVFIAVGDRISKFVVNAKGFSFEQRAREANKELQRIAVLRDNQHNRVIHTILNAATGTGAATWTSLIVYRLALRVLLRQICQTLGMKLDIEGRPTPMTDMLRYLHEHGALSDTVLAKVEQLRDATYFIEWGIGDPPSVVEIENALKIAPPLLQSLAVKAAQTQPPQSPTAQAEKS
jgi:hypothetical protein